VTFSKADAQNLHQTYRAMGNKSANLYLSQTQTSQPKQINTLIIQ